MMRSALLCLGLFACIACQAQVGATLNVPRDSAATCAGYCQSIGLPLDSVVIMANNVGCVCSAQQAMPQSAPPGAPPPQTTMPASRRGASGSGGGMAAIMIQDAEEHQRQQTYQQQHHY